MQRVILDCPFRSQGRYWSNCRKLMCLRRLLEQLEKADVSEEHGSDISGYCPDLDGVLQVRRGVALSAGNRH